MSHFTPSGHHSASTRGTLQPKAARHIAGSKSPVKLAVSKLPRPRRIRQNRIQPRGQGNQLDPQAIGLFKLGQVRIGNNGANAMNGLYQALVLKPGQHPTDRRAAGAKFLCQGHLREARSRQVIQQANPLTDLVMHQGMTVPHRKTCILQSLLW